MKVAILNYKGVVPTSVVGPFDMLDKVASVGLALNIQTPVTFEVDIVNTDEEVSSLKFNVVGNKTIRTRKVYDFILVPAMYINYIPEVLQRERGMINWIKYQYSKGCDIGSICLGAFLLAETGLLDGKRATTHWMGVPEFRRMYPGVQLQHHNVIIDEGRIYTCGAAYSFTTLMIYLIEKFCGRDMALAMSKVFMIQVHGAGQDAFSIFNLQHTHNDAAIRDVQQFISKNYKDKLSVKAIGERFNMSQRSFARKFKEVTGNTPLEYIQRVKVEVAKRQLEQGRHTVEEISLGVGYEDFNSFRNIFKRFTGLTPQDYKRRYSQMFLAPILG
ncbi:MAG TPA: helix-turn-helix domain-containing protein [Chitinophagaceae bacterium]|nr:helix-turn-helix domain-containing protein [Chitinophagaceae bacterium]